MKPSKGFVCLPVEVLQAGLSAGALKALAGLLSFRNRKTGLCNPSVNKLCEKLGGVPNTTVRRWLRELKKAGIVTPVCRAGRSNSYEVTLSIFGQGTLSIFGQGTLSIFGRQKPPHPYMNQKKFEPEKASASVQGSSKRSAAVAAAAASSGNTNTNTAPGLQVIPRKDVGREISIVRDSLHNLAREIHLPLPDDDLVRMVVEAARGAPGENICETLVALWKRGRFQSIRGWGLVPVLVGKCYGAVS